LPEPIAEKLGKIFGCDVIVLRDDADPKQVIDELEQVLKTGLVNEMWFMPKLLESMEPPDWLLEGTVDE
jgi:hypothetical protein